VWGRATVGSVERDLITPIVGGGETIEFNNSYTQDEDTVTIGWDLISRDGAGGSWLVGGMIGHTRSTLSFDESPNVAKLRGMHAGVYTSLTQGGFYLDAVFNLTRLDVDNDVPSLALSPDTAQLETEADSTGGRLEAGYRFMAGPVGIEPLAGLSWVKTQLDEIDVPADDPTRFGGTVQFKSSTANNASAGLRLSMEDLLPNVAPTGISLTVRGIDEINGRAEVSVDNLGPIPAVTSDTLEGSYTQLTGSVNVTNPSKTLAGYVNVDVLTGDDYDSNSVSAGVRYQW
jgi:outer membrane autotransporter protein